jgi:PBP1b-binding outer membrane lipoprotein LpoB
MNEQDVKNDANRAFVWGRGKLLGLTAAGVVILALAIAFLLKGCGTPDKPKIDTKTQKSIDSLNATKPQFEKTKDSIITVVVHDTIRAAAVDRAANQTVARAQVAEHRADSLAAVAQQHSDSAILWHNAYDARTVEADTLRKAVAQKDSAFQAERLAFVNLSALYGADTLRRIATEKVNLGLQNDIKKLQQPCTVPGTFGKIPCPSRTVTLVLTAAAVEGIHIAAKSAKP